jgi:hypothetical protein
MHITALGNPIFFLHKKFDKIIACASIVGKTKLPLINAKTEIGKIINRRDLKSVILILEDDR